MSRSTVPSSIQVKKLLQLIDEKRFLATGHARTTHARDKTRAAWEEIALKLNSDTGGCIKSWQQWAKYWKDKKAAIKKKASLMRTARLKTDGGVGEQITLSSLEERVVSLMGGEDFAIGDSELEMNSFHSLQEGTDQNSESILQQPLPGPSTSREGNIGYCDNISHDHHPCIETTSPQPAVPHSSRTASLSPRRRRPLTARRRILTRTPPSQRQSMLARLTERFIALKEKRLENERLLFENQDKMFNIFMEVNRTMSRQTQALQELCSATKALTEKINRS